MVNPMPVILPGRIEAIAAVAPRARAAMLVVKVVTSNNNNCNNHCISRAPFHVKHAQLR